MKYFLGLVLFSLFFVPQTIFAIGNFGIRPAYPQADNPRTESIFIHKIVPGESKDDGVKVINGTDSLKKVYVYSTDSEKSTGGSFACAQEKKERGGVGDWIKFDFSELDEEVRNEVLQKQNGFEINLPASTEIIIPFKIKLPSNVSVGEHNGCIVVQEVKEDANNAGVNLTVRSGIRVAITVPGEVKRELQFIGFDVERSGKRVNLKASVKNSGNVSIDTKVAIKVKHFFGVLFKEFGGNFPVLRDETSDFNFEMKNPMLGGIFFTHAVFSYDNNNEAIIGVDTKNLPTELKSETFWFALLPRGLGYVVWAGIIFLIWFIWNFIGFKKEQKKIIASWPDYVVQDGETVGSIAKDFKLPWKFIVKANEIKAPYMLMPGQKLKLPPRKKKYD